MLTHYWYVFAAKKKEAAIVVSSSDAYGKENDPEVTSLSDREDALLSKSEVKRDPEEKSKEFCFGQIRNDLKAKQPGLCVREAVRYARLDRTEQRV